MGALRLDEQTITRIKVSNFKSFDDMTTELRKFNVIIGANASGKSNFVGIFKFLKDVFAVGLDNAVAMQGGVDSIQNMNIRSKKDLTIELLMRPKAEDAQFPISMKLGKRRITAIVNPVEIAYAFHLEFYKRKRGYVVKEERFESSLEVIKEDKEKKLPRKGSVLAKGRVVLTLDKLGRFEYQKEPGDFPVSINQILPFTHLKKKIPRVRAQRYRKELALLGPSLVSATRYQSLALYSPLSSHLRSFLNEMALYDIDPKLSKKSTLITGKTELDSDGSNLATVLKNVLSSRKNRRKLSNLMRDLLPFIEDISVEKLADRSLLACLREIYCGRKYLPAPLISDGTINLTALIIALYFEKNPFIVVEEPERNIHPRLISKIVDMMKDVSEKMGKQIIITTHNPEVVKNAGIENLLLIYREKGFSRIDRPADKERVRNFLRNEIGVDELFVKDLLEV
jgi:predicted ATPase